MTVPKLNLAEILRDSQIQQKNYDSLDNNKLIPQSARPSLGGLGSLTSRKSILPFSKDKNVMQKLKSSMKSMVEKVSVINKKTIEKERIIMEKKIG